ncbi:MAG TPA: hypothetical protein VKZ63_03585 [Kofleriaceae bacterium]|nr:hypothetical protein [Kofleriaceae bacterium]
MTRASAPGKVMLAGEYAVLAGAPAVVMAVDRRARARIAGGAGAALSPFLAAARDALARELGEDSAAARAAATAEVDSTALRDPSGVKLGLGSSAAATVAALAAALAAGDPAAPLDRALLHRLAHRAHGDAQAAAGARGSGADVAASVWGGVQRIDPPAAPGAPPRTSPLTLPAGLELVTVWTGAPADTCAMVARVEALGARAPAVRAELYDQIARAAATLVRACEEGRAGLALLALGAAARAAGELGRAAGAPIATAGHDELDRRAAAAGGVVKPTGAGGGDIALGAFPAGGAAAQFRADAARLGMKVVDLGVDPDGARVESTA